MVMEDSLGGLGSWPLFLTICVSYSTPTPHTYACSNWVLGLDCKEGCLIQVLHDIQPPRYYSDESNMKIAISGPARVPRHNEA